MADTMQSVIVAHASFWYTNGDRFAIAVRGDVIEVGPEDYARGQAHGAFFVEPKPEDVGVEVGVEPAEQPARSAPKAEWEAYARTQGATDDDLEGQTKDELVTLYGG